MDPAPSGLNPGQRDYTKFWRLHEPAHTTAVTAGRLLWVINRKAQVEHISSAFSEESRRSHAARNAALVALRLLATPPLKPLVKLFIRTG